MNEDYLNLGYSLDALIITCINSQDYTRVPRPGPVNPYLGPLCNNLQTLNQLNRLASAAKDLVKGQVLAPPVNPAAVGMQTTPAKQPAKAATAPGSDKSAEIKAAQTKLQTYCTDLKADGKLGPLTMACIREFQRNNKLTPSGNLDGDTLKALGVDK
jgi:hypothetical protein